MSIADAVDHEHRHPILEQAEASLGTPHRTIELCKEVLRHTRKELGEHEFCRAHYLHGFANRLVGELSVAESELFFAKQLATSLGAKALVANSTMQLGLVYVDEQQYERAIDLLRAARSQFAEQHLLGEEARACFSLSIAYQQLKQEAEAIAHLEEALIKFSDAGSDEGVTAVHVALVHFAMDRGNFLEAKERAEMCLKVLPAKSLPKNRIFLNLALAESCRQLGQADRALEIIGAAIESASREGYPLLEARGLVLQHLAYIGQDEPELAAFSLEKAEELSHLHGFEAAFIAMKEEHSI